MTQPLSGRVAAITGASAGIGEAIARSLSRAGAKVILNARRRERLETLVAELGQSNAAALAGDACEDQTIREMLDLARHRFGDGKRDADLVVVNAGRGLRGGLYDSDPARWEETFRLNVLSAAKLMREAARRMEAMVPYRGAEPATPDGGGAAPHLDPSWLDHPRDIIVLGSSVGRNLSPFSSLYGSAKAAVHMLAESLRRTMSSRGIRVTLIEPAVVKSEFQDAAGYDPVAFGKFMDSISPVLTPEDVARVVLFIVTQPPGVHINEVMMRPTRQEYP